MDPLVDYFTYSKPLMVENFLDGDSMIYVGREHSLYEIFRRLADGIPEWCLHLQIQLNWNYLTCMRRIPRSEWCERFEITRRALLKFLNRSFFIRISIRRDHKTITCTRPRQIASRSLSRDPTNGSVPVNRTWSNTPADQTSPGFPYCRR